MVTIRCHHDADGITAGYFTSYAIPNSNLEIWDGDFGDTKGLKDGDYMVDMRPTHNLKGLMVIDHHPPYPDVTERKYDLITGSVPASLLCLEKYKSDVPNTEWWKVSIGLMGDGQPELIPAEVFKLCPQLLQKWKTSVKIEKWGTYSISYHPIYRLLSSGINALLRKNEFEKAINLIRYAENPLDLLTAHDIQVAKNDIKNEMDSIMRNCMSIDYDNLTVIIFYSDYRMSGYVASTLQAFSKKTILAINGKNGRGSLRGDLSLYFKDLLSQLDYIVIDGHPGFMGLSLNVNPDVFVSDLHKIL